METTYESHVLRDGKEVKLATHNIDRGDHVDSYSDIMVRTRTGKKVHKGRMGSSVTNCGIWLRVNGSHFKMNPAQVSSMEHCYPAQQRKGGLGNSEGPFGALRVYRPR